MANSEQLKILKQGVAVWNNWRHKHKSERIDLSRTDLSDADLTRVDFSRTNLSNTDLTGADLAKANLRNADLCHAKLGSANLFSADLSNADLSNADFTYADLNHANLSNANLAEAFLISANLTSACLENTDLSGARTAYLTFGRIDLSKVLGLDKVVHIAPSTIGIDTLYQSRGEMPDKFLRDAGVPEEVIDIARSIRAGPAIQWHSCFISYSTKDEAFARRLHSRMREANLRVWFAPEDLKGGKKLHEQLFEAIQLHDRLLLVLSEHSIQSEWVTTEIRKARETEKKENRRKLFPIRLTSLETLRGWTCFDADTGKDLAIEVREYFIPDFSNWKAHDAFETAFVRLKKDLQERSKPHK
jgi:hypothetical protein